jgi:hypothetical protein
MYAEKFLPIRCSENRHLSAKKEEIAQNGDDSIGHCLQTLGQKLHVQGVAGHPG